MIARAFVQAVRAFSDDSAQRLAAAIAFSAMFSIAPLFIVVIAIVGNVLDTNGGHGGHSAVRDALLDRIRAGAGADAALTVRHLIETTYAKPRQGFVASLVGWFAFVLGACGLFAALQDALNVVWHVDSKKGGWKRMLRDRLMSFIMILVVGALLLASFVANQFLALATTHLHVGFPFPGAPQLADLVADVVNVAIATLAFAAILKILPDAEIAWRDVWRGAFATAVLFTIGEAAIELYFTFAGISSAYGAAGSLLIALLWIYYSAMILLLGAEFTKIDAGRTGAPSAKRQDVRVDVARAQPKASN